MIEPKEFTFSGADGVEKTVVLHKFPACYGREILCKYPLSALPKLGDYAVNHETMLKLMAYVGVKVEGRDSLLMLSTQALIDNHVYGAVNLIKIEKEMLEYNFGFFANGLTSNFLNDLRAKAQVLTTKILTALSEQLSQKGAQR